mgnify:CR=1 FL=1
MRIGKQIAENITNHQKAGKDEVKKRVLEMLRLVGIADAKGCVKKYPHELSGGMRQRVMIATALAGNPEILIADEPTTALDVTIQAQIMDLLVEIQQKLGMTVILITHDLGVVANSADRVVVMYSGKVVETGTCTEIFEKHKHPYTWGASESGTGYGVRVQAKACGNRRDPAGSHSSSERLSVCRAVRPLYEDLSGNRGAPVHIQQRPQCILLAVSSRIWLYRHHI